MGANDAKTKESQRKQTRYAVSEDCRVRAAIRIRSSDATSANKDWPGTLVDLSSGGAHIQISMAAVAFIGDSCTLKLSHGTMKAELRGVLAHYICSSRYSVCGVKFDSTFAGSDGGHQPFLKAIIASATLKGGPTDSEVPTQYREEYRGPGFIKLVVWRDNKPLRMIMGFDYTMSRYTAVLTGAGEDMLKNKAQVAFKAAPTENGDAEAALTAAQLAEARWEFSLAASNLPNTIPPDLRRFLRLVS